jgi:recombination protein RecT
MADTNQPGRESMADANAGVSTVTTRPFQNLRTLLAREDVIKEVGRAAPQYLTPARVIRVALTCVQKTPELQECDALSILGCLIQATQLGLELDGVLGQAYMVPFSNKKTGRKEAQFLVGYRGLISLARRSGHVAYIAAHIVREGDRFEYRQGTKRYLEHCPLLGRPGKPVAVYAIMKTAAGEYDWEVMSWEDVLAHAQRYSRAVGTGPWQTSPEEMAKKTVLRRLLKRCDMCVEAKQVATLDEYADAMTSQRMPASELPAAYANDPGPAPLPSLPPMEDGEEEDEEQH